jgi:hypothetical protein
LVVQAPASLGPFLAYKGSITVNGVSLTVNRVEDLAGGTQNLIEDVFKDIAASVTEFSGLTLSKIGHLGTVITETGYEIPLLKNEGVRKAAGIING